MQESRRYYSLVTPKGNRPRDKAVPVYEVLLRGYFLCTRSENSRITLRHEF